MGLTRLCGAPQNRVKSSADLEALGEWGRMAWNDQPKKHFEGRRELALHELVDEFGVSDENAENILSECLGVFEEAYRISGPLLRPGDPLRLFIDPPSTWNPIRWYWYRVNYEEGTSDLNYRLKKRRRKLGRPLNRSPMTVGDYVSAWFGDDL